MEEISWTGRVRHEEVLQRAKKERIIIIIYYRYSALGPVWAGTRAQSGDWYGSGTLHPGQVLRGSLPLLSPKERIILNKIKRKVADWNCHILRRNCLL